MEATFAIHIHSAAEQYLIITRKLVNKRLGAATSLASFLGCG
jgi:hypothetical protein